MLLFFLFACVGGISIRELLKLAATGREKCLRGSVCVLDLWSKECDFVQKVYPSFFSQSFRSKSS